MSRWIPLAFGAALFVWLRLEDNAVWTAALFGVGVAALGVRALLAQRPIIRVGVAALAGGLIGGGGAVGAAALMLLKNGLHGHLFPDYPFGVIEAMLARAPAWALAGLLAGAGWGMIAKQPAGENQR